MIFLVIRAVKLFLSRNNRNSDKGVWKNIIEHVFRAKLFKSYRGSL